MAIKPQSFITQGDTIVRSIGVSDATSDNAFAIRKATEVGKVVSINTSNHTVAITSNVTLEDADVLAISNEYGESVNALTVDGAVESSSSIVFTGSTGISVGDTVYTLGDNISGILPTLNTPFEIPNSYYVAGEAEVKAFFV